MGKGDEESLLMYTMVLEGLRESESRKLRRCIWLIYFRYKSEYRIFKPAEITIKRG
jgi:hypothetical protein